MSYTQVRRTGFLFCRWLLCSAALLFAVSGALALRSPSVSAATLPTFPVMNTSETLPDGVWFRNSAHTDDTDRKSGHGVYAGDTIRVFCYTNGDAVGPYNNTVWYFATNLTRPTVDPVAQESAVPNTGYINSHYVNDQMTANTPSPGVPPCLPQLSTAGNHILQNGYPFVFHGVNRDTLEWGDGYRYGNCGGDGNFKDSDFDAIRAWNFTAVRLPLSQANLLGRRCDSARYLQMIDDAVAKINARGMYAILDLHWSDVYGQAECDPPCTSGQQPMPDTDSVAFWQQIAFHFANNPGVIFDLYNEPHPNATPGIDNVGEGDWNCWISGGCTVTATTNPSITYTAVGMQQLYDTVRASASQNLILVGGPDWASTLAGVLNGHTITGTNFAYDVHVYTQFPNGKNPPLPLHNTPAIWKATFGDVASVYPVVATEFGSLDCGTTDTARLLNYFDAPEGHPENRMSWAIWSWFAPGECSQPSIIQDYNGTPLHGQGQLIYDYLNPILIA